MEVRCLYPFKARQRDELSFSAGEILNIVKHDDSSEWWLAMNTSKKAGYIPTNLVEIIPGGKLPVISPSGKMVGSQSVPTLGTARPNRASKLPVLKGRIDGAHNMQSSDKTARRLFQDSKAELSKPVVSVAYDNRISSDPSNPYQPERRRYELIVNYGCPFAARPWLCLNLLGLDEVIRVVRTFPACGSGGWFFRPVSDEERKMVSEHPDVQWEEDGPSCGDSISHLKELYLRTNPNYSDAISVPVLYDTKTRTIVSNNSLDIASMISTQFDASWRKEGVIYRRGPNRRDMMLVPLTADQPNSEYATMLKTMHDKLSMGVYKIYFSKTQRDFESNTTSFFMALDGIESLLSHQKFVMGDTITLLDILLFVTVVRMPLVYEKLFKVDMKHMNEITYPHIWRHAKSLCHAAGVSETLHVKSIKMTYYLSDKLAAMAGKLTVPIGPPDIDLPIFK